MQRGDCGDMRLSDGMPEAGRMYPKDIHMSDFEGVVSALQQALSKRGYEKLTPVQEAVLAPELVTSDALVSAQTGSGKTVAFGLAMAPTLLDGAERFSRADVPLALVIAPTRELALQVKREFDWLFAETGASIASCVGGMDSRTERRALERGAHIVVGTPGRLKDHIMRGALDLSNLRVAVLDEADEMLDLGFSEDLEFILDASPETRRTLLFSATVPRSIASLAKKYQRDAVRISTTAEKSQHVDIEYRALTIAPRDQENAIINVLRYYDAKNALVFCATRATVNHMTARLNNRGFSVVALSGELSQNERTHALQAMRDGRARVCVATDVAARGIDLPGLELVVHADLPQNAEILLHRSGRTGRAGSKGVSALIVPKSQSKKAERLLTWAKINAKWDKPPSAQAVLAKDNDRLMEKLSELDAAAGDEAEMVNRLTEAHSAEQLATAFLRMHREKASAPEELADVSSGPDTKRKPREEFTQSVWVKLSIGRNQKAEPRWLLPMLCRAGDITKADIGAIKLQGDESHVQLNAKSADGFFAAVGPAAKLEDGITIERMSGAPKASSGDYQGKPAGSGGYKGKKPYGDSPRGERSGGDKPRYDKPRGDKPYGDKPRGEKSYGDKPRGDKPYGDKPRGEKSYGDKSYGDKPRGDKPYAKKSYGDKPYAGKKDAGKWDDGKGEGAKKYGSKSAPRKPKSEMPDGVTPYAARGKDTAMKDASVSYRSLKPGAGNESPSRGTKKPRHTAAQKAAGGAGKGKFAKPTGGKFAKPSRKPTR